jgi:predicted nucleic acid-binding protein
MAIILVDTDVYSYISSSNPTRGIPYKRHLDGHILALSFITVGEQYAGYRKMIGKGEWPESRIQKLETLLKSVVVIPYDVEICKVYGELKNKIRNPDGSHRVISPNDLWIAACAVRHSLKLATNNRSDFENIPGLDIICEAPPTR